MSQFRFLVFLIGIGFCLQPAFAAKDTFAKARKSLVEMIREDVQETSRYLKKEALDEKVMTAMATVPRHLFIPENLAPLAYENRPLPIGHGQTISQPYIVAIMTDLIGPKPGDRVLEIGTGSGYQAAILAQLVNEVYSIEIIEPLGVKAKQRFKKLGYKNIQSRVGDGYYGWKEAAPFDSIVVTAASSHVPPPLIKQLKPGGHLIIPVGSRFLVQKLVLIKKQKDGSVITRQILPVRFVPLTGEH